MPDYVLAFKNQRNVEGIVLKLNNTGFKLAATVQDANSLKDFFRPNRKPEFVVADGDLDGILEACKNVKSRSRKTKIFLFGSEEVSAAEHPYIAKSYKFPYDAQEAYDDMFNSYVKF